ncbi:tyrosine-protein kinase SRK2-like [Saccostrea echinata]|uniref:tyrosine-protein kinase SRK2-like n=1 Tax=Saccostrea echinata TaxID=191078 RepID=UPI002A7F3304|nr:tyrosine-protein kinase SRK2-like [Saccostrea echinata]
MEGRKRECKAKLSNVVRKAGEKGRILMGLGKSLEGDKVNLLQEAPLSLSESEDGFTKGDSRTGPNCDTIVKSLCFQESAESVRWNFVDKEEDFSDKCVIRLSGRKTSDDWSSEGVRGSDSEIRRWSNNDVISSETEKSMISLPCDKLERFSTMPKLRRKKKTFIPEWLTMAKTPSSRSSLREKLQEEFLSCKICLESFIKPKALPCLHSFCEHCLRDYVRRHPGEKPGHFPCPMCRKDVKIPERGIGDFQDNFLLLSLSDTLEEDEEPWRFSPSPGKQQTSNSLVSPPRTFAPPTPQEQHLRTFDWYFGKVSRQASEDWLLSPGYPKGTYLVRQGEAAPDTYTLSVRDCDELRGYIVKHYKIHTQRDPHVAFQSYFITPRKRFKTLSELVNHYTDNADGLCCKLQQICMKPRSLIWAFDRGKPDEYASTRDTVLRVRKLGSGQFAEVWLARWHSSRDIAVKIQKKDAVSSAAFLDEAQLLKQLQHPNIIKLLGVSSETTPIYLLLEYMINGRLSNYLREGKGHELGLSQLLWIAAQIAEGMAFLEKEHFVHRNLGARNILVGERNVVKIAGFGMAKVQDDPDFNFRRGLKMAIKWMSPEVLLCNKYGTKGDVWTFGIVLIEIFTYGKEPYEGMGSKEAFEHVQQGYRMPKPDICPQEVYEVILTCWNSNPPSRPSFDFLNTFLHDYQSS